RRNHRARLRHAAARHRIGAARAIACAGGGAFTRHHHAARRLAADAADVEAGHGVGLLTRRLARYVDHADAVALLVDAEALGVHAVVFVVEPLAVLLGAVR